MSAFTMIFLKHPAVFSTAFELRGADDAQKKMGGNIILLKFFRVLKFDGL
jgi:hypothetical protein